MAGGLSTHALDLTSGGPAAGMRVAFSVLRDGAYHWLKTLTTNSEGRTDEFFLDADTMTVGSFEFVFEVGEYFASSALKLPSPLFFDRVPVRFAIADPREHYHVPLLVAPWGYSVYRGS
jgi:5-hydroxyisourate hydrolase